MAKMLKQVMGNVKIRRSLAALLGIVIVVQMVFGSLGTMSAYADDTLHFTITVKESELLKHVAKVADAGPEEVPEIKDSCLPFANAALREDARNQIMPYLLGTAVVKQYPSLGENCAAIVAVSGSEDYSSEDSENHFAIEDIVFIGLNGNTSKKCEFTLQITDAKNMVIHSMTVVGYAQSGSVASSSDALPEVDIASSSDALPDEPDVEIASSSDALPNESEAEKVISPEVQPSEGEAEKVISPEVQPSESEAEKVISPEVQPSESEAEKVVNPEVNPGESETGNVINPEVNSGESETGSAINPEVNSGESETGNVINPEVNSGESETGSAINPEVNPGESETGNAINPEVNSGESETGNVINPEVKPDVEVASSSQASDNMEGAGSVEVVEEIEEDTVSVQVGYGFEEVFQEELSEDELSGLLKRKEDAVSLLMAVVDEEVETKGPSMLIGPCGFGVAVAKNGSSTGGKVAQINVTANQESVPSGAVATVYVAADYSAIDEQLPDNAYFAVQFEVLDHHDNAYEGISGPESGSNAVKVDNLNNGKEEDWNKIRHLLESGQYSEAAQKEDWVMVTEGTTVFFYSPSEKLAVFGIENGGTSITNLPMTFRFNNGVTPNGSTITATPSILNKQELQDAYNGNGPGDESVLIEGEPVTIISEAQFFWQDVVKDSSSSMGNMAAGTGVSDEIVYKLFSRKIYPSDTGRLYTKEYTIHDVMTFDGFYLDLEGYQLKEQEEKNGGLLKGEWILTKDGKTVTKVLGLRIPGDHNDTGIAKPLYLNNDPSTNKVTGFEVTYKVQNESLSKTAASDMEDIVQNTLNVYFGLGNILKNAKKIIVYESSADLPSIKNKVEFDAYSIMHEEGSVEEPNDGLTNHHSTSNKDLSTTAGYTLEKSAFTDAEYKTAATGDNKIFEPGSWVYYKITANNNGYANEQFKIVDTYPDGLDADSIETIKVTVNQTEISQDGYTDVRAEGGIKTWDKILIPSGGQAAIYFKAQVKPKDDFKNGAIKTTLPNSAELFRSESAGNRLAFGDATVYVNLNTLQAEELNFTKEVKTADDKTPAVGSELVYTLNASLTKEVKNPHWITIKDQWPSEVSLKKITEIPPQTTIRITDSNGNELRTYENTGKGSGTLDLSKLSQNKGIIVTARVLLTPEKPNVAMKLSGTIQVDGEFKNYAEAGGGSGWTKPGTVTTFAVGAAIDKKAYYINRSQEEITEENSLLHPVDQSITFRSGDVVCYNIKLSNKGKNTLTAQMTDDVTNLFGTTPVQYAEATLNGQTGAVFKKLPGEKWEKIEVSDNGKAIDLPVELKTTEAAEFRIYLKIPNPVENQFVVNRAEAEVIHEGKTYKIAAEASITINQDVQKASIEKEVYAVAREIDIKANRLYLKGARWNDARLGTESSGYNPTENPLKVGKDDFVFYRITIHNNGEEPLNIYEIEDWLPEGMKFERFYAFNGDGNQANPRVPGAMDETDTLDLGPSTRAPLFNSGKQNWLFFDDATSGEWNNNAAAVVNHGNGNSTVNGSLFRARLYDRSVDTSLSNIATVPVGKSVVYGIIAQVSGDFGSGVILTNETGVVVDQSAITDYEKDKSVNVLSGSVGKRSYSDNLHKITTATADVVTTGIYTPGIEKQLAQYETLGVWYDYNEGGTNEGLIPNHPMRWNITLHNGTKSYMSKGAIENYTLKDTLPAGLYYNEKDLDSNYIQNLAGKRVALPLPNTETETDGSMTVSWQVEKQPDGTYLIIGKDGAAEQTAVDLSIPVKKTLAVQIGTVSGENGAKYGTYVNQADLIPDGYSFEEACAGEVVKNNNGNAAAVHAEASVDIFSSDGKTEAWKEITGTFNGSTETVTGRDRTKNTVIADAGSNVKYSLNVKSQASNGIEDLVIVDRLPVQGDNGVVNNMRRKSEFAVRFADSPNVKVSLVKADGTGMTLDEANYQVSYADWNRIIGSGQALPTSYWEPGIAKGWSQTPEGADSLRIEISNEVKVETGDTVVVTFNAVLPEAKDLNLANTLIAWNTFGYAYKATGSTNMSTVTVEPPKVGVQIPTAMLSVTKKVESRLDEDKAADNQFTFSIEENVSGQWEPKSDFKFKLTSTGANPSDAYSDADGRFTLAHGQTAEFTVLAGRSYRVKEISADGYYVTVTDFDGTVSNTEGKNSSLFDPKNPPTASLKLAQNGKHYYCTYTNTRSSFFLPETGGIGTGIFHRGGAALIVLSLLMMAGTYMSTAFKTGRKKKRMKCQ